MSRSSIQRALLALALWSGAWAAPLLYTHAAAAQDEFEDFADDENDESASDDDEESSDDEAAEEDEADDERAAEAEADLDEAAPNADVSMQAFAGAGLGTRGFRRPDRGMGVQRMDDVPFLALDAGLRVTAWPAESFSLEFLLRYQTSVGMVIEQQPRFAPVNEVPARSSRVEFSIAPEFQLGDTPSSASLLFPVGFGLRTLWPEVHTLPVPGYTLGGPLLRIELALPFFDVVTLRFGPEAQWVVLIDQLIVDDGTGYSGVALGGEALLRVQVSTLVGIEFAFRESHVIAPTSVKDENFVDIERFFTLRLSGTW